MGEHSVSTEQQNTLDAILRRSALPVGSEVGEQRRLLRELTSAQPLPSDVTLTSTTLGGVPVAAITIDGVEPRHVVLYFHGGVYVLGDAASAAGLASQVGRMDRRQGLLRRLPARPRAPVPGGGGRRTRDLRSPPEGRHRPHGHRPRRRVRGRWARHRHPGQRPGPRTAAARRGLRHVAVRRPHPRRGFHRHQASRRSAALPGTPRTPGHRLHGGTGPLARPDQPRLRRPLGPAAAPHPGRQPRGAPRRRRTPRPTGHAARTCRSRWTSPRVYRTSSRPTVRSSTRRPPPWRGPDSS